MYLFSVLKTIKEVFKKKGHSALKVIVGKYFTVIYQVKEQEQ